MDALLLRALKSQPKSVNLDNKKLEKVPKLIGKLVSTLHITLKNNRINELPQEFGDLIQVRYVFSIRALTLRISQYQNICSRKTDASNNILSSEKKHNKFCD